MRAALVIGAFVAAVLASSTALAQVPTTGDVDCDGSLTIGDAVRLTQFVIDEVPDAADCGVAAGVVGANAAAGNLDHDDTITTLDAMYLVQCAIGIPAVVGCPGG